MWQRKSRVRVNTNIRVLALSLTLVAIVSVWKSSDRIAQASVLAAQDDAGRSASRLENPDKRCAKCHAAIYKQYEQSDMARGSGTANDGFIGGEFQHKPSGVTYRVSLHNDTPVMSYHRDYSPEVGALEGERALRYFVGSNEKGRTFLYQQDGLWFELPINYYARKGGWDMAPAFDNAKRMPAPLPTDPNCLHCHATSISPSQNGVTNSLGERPFAQGGIGCNACHGDPSAHLAQGGRGPIVNPNKLSATKRDSTCLQCHLEGNAVVYRPGKSLADFKAGEDLNDTALYFVHASQALGGSRATSQYEALLQSACKRGAGDKLTCTTCHNPHGDPPAAQRVAYFRARCLSCHTDPSLAATHHPEQPDCASCHMPSRDTSDISHEQVTDHNIQKRPAVQTTLRAKTGEELVPVGGVNAGNREFGLAYAQLAQKGDRVAGERALALLTKAEKAGAIDEQVHLNLAFLEQISGNVISARDEYSVAIAANPSEATALSNLAVLDFQAGDVSSAVALLTRAFHADPSRTSAGLNLAFLQCKLGHVNESRSTAAKLREFNPDSPELLTFIRTGSYGGQRCDAIVSRRQ